MKISVSILARDRALVRFTPSWFDRLLGERVDDRVAVAFPTLPRGHLAWHWDSNGRLVPHYIVRLINDAVVKKTWDKIMGREAK